MTKDPAFLFYASDFLTGTMFMTDEQVGKYIRLLCSQHQHGGIIDKQSFEAIVGEHKLLKSKFTETEQGYFNERLLSEMEKRNKKSNNISEAVKKVWDERKSKAIVMESHAITLESQKNPKGKVKKNDGIPMGTEDVNEDVNITNKEELNPFINFWNLYNKKLGDKSACEKKWKKLKEEEREAILKYIPSYLNTITDKQFQPYPETFLNQRRWENELPSAPKKELSITQQYGY